MATVSRIDVWQPDRGLMSCMEAANIHPTWSDLYIKQHKLETLEDFIYLLPSDTWEKSLQSNLDAIADLRSKPLVLARFKGAYEAGLQAVRQAAQPASRMSADSLDDVLPESTLATVSKDYKASYNIDIDPALEPADSLRSRIFREFRKGAMTVIPMAKVKSLLHQSNPKSQESVAISGTIKLEFDQESPVNVGSVIAYYWGLRTLAYGWSWAGQFKHRDPDGVERVFISLSEAQNYADEALRLTTEYGSGSLLWLTRCDTVTRGKMATSVRRGWSAGAALKEAMQQTFLEWRAPAMQPVPSNPKVRPPPEPTFAPEPKKPRHIKTDKWPTVSMVKGGRRICKRYNDARGCPGCDDIHGCDVRLASGKACLAKDHNRLSHQTE